MKILLIQSEMKKKSSRMRKRGIISSTATSGTSNRRKGLRRRNKTVSDRLAEAADWKRLQMEVQAMIPIVIMTLVKEEMRPVS